MRHLKKIFKSYQNIVFPQTCACCGSSTSEQNCYLCEWCKLDRFEKACADPGNFLPERIRFCFSMWYFDKGGYLQKLLHDLKYHHLKGVGVELGECLGRAFLHRLDSSMTEEFALAKPLLVPVPLYKSRQRKRGYNQARAMAEGVARVTSWPVARQGLIIRTKNTKTQTGLNSLERENNLAGAFEITDSAELQDKFPILIDDVFTTGSTTFEVAKTILKDDQKAGILTVAKA